MSIISISRNKACLFSVRLQPLEHDKKKKTQAICRKKIEPLSQEVLYEDTGRKKKD